MTKQEVYDTVCAHLAQQKTRSHLDGQGCAYRGREGRKCAVGCLISDDEYSPDMECKIVGTLSCYGELPDRLRPFVHLLRELQKAHDFCATPEAIRHYLLRTAERHDIIPGAERAITEWGLGG